MSWFRLDDKFHSNGKVLAAGNAAVGLYVRCGTWSADHGTEGHIPKLVASAYGTKGEIAKLVAMRLWREESDEYVMPDYLDFNLSNDEVEDLRRKRSEAGQKGGLKSGQVRKKRGSNEANDEANAQANGQQNEANTNPDPDPTRPDPTPTGASTQQTDRLPTVAAVGQSVIEEALNLYGKHVHDLDPDGCTTTPARRIAGIARTAANERHGRIAQHMSEHPNSTTAELLAGAFDLTELEVWRLTGQARRKGA